MTLVTRNQVLKTKMHRIPSKIRVSHLFLSNSLLFMLAKWMVVYTNYGYGEVDFEEFKRSINETTAKM